MAGELFINDRLVDLDQSIPFPLTFNISDIKDLTARKGKQVKDYQATWHQEKS
jgi:hypothetical protein